MRPRGLIRLSWRRLMAEPLAWLPLALLTLLLAGLLAAQALQQTEPELSIALRARAEHAAVADSLEARGLTLVEDDAQAERDRLTGRISGVLDLGASPPRYLPAPQALDARYVQSLVAWTLAPREAEDWLAARLMARYRAEPGTGEGAGGARGQSRIRLETQWLGGAPVTRVPSQARALSRRRASIRWPCALPAGHPPAAGGAEPRAPSLDARAHAPGPPARCARVTVYPLGLAVALLSVAVMQAWAPNAQGAAHAAAVLALWSLFALGVNQLLRAWPPHGTVAGLLLWTALALGAGPSPRAGPARRTPGRRRLAPYRRILLALEAAPLAAPLILGLIGLFCLYLGIIPRRRSHL